MDPLDLTKSPPRSARAELNGIAYLPRVIDKFAPNSPGGNLGDYLVMAETGATITGQFYRVTGIVHDEFMSIIKSDPNEAVVGAWLQSRLDDETIARWNMRSPRSYCAGIADAFVLLRSQFDGRNEAATEVGRYLARERGWVMHPYHRA